MPPHNDAASANKQPQRANARGGTGAAKRTTRLEIQLPHGTVTLVMPPGATIAMLKAAIAAHPKNGVPVARQRVTLNGAAVADGTLVAKIFPEEDAADVALDVLPPSHVPADAAADADPFGFELVTARVFKLADDDTRVPAAAATAAAATSEAPAEEKAAGTSWGAAIYNAVAFWR